MFAPDVDLVIAFRVSKAKTTRTRREEGRKAEKQYSRLIETLRYAGLKAVGRRGQSLGHLLVFVTCPDNVLVNLVVRERRSDFLSGLPVAPVTVSTAASQQLSPADRIRLVHAYISSTPSDGGLGISADAPEWDLVECISPLHDRALNESWVRSASPSLAQTRAHFGDALALYFAFLSSYTTFLIFPALLGFLAHFFLGPYSPTYSLLLALWSTLFVEWWRVHERILSLRFGTRNVFRVERRRALYRPAMPWYTRELRILLTLPVIALFGAILVGILTAIFVFEAFITHLYEGPGKRVVGFSPTILFVVLVPRFLGLYQYLAVRMTRWENHRHQSSYTASLTLKTFALGALVAYSGLALSAFVYVPFGEGVMGYVQKRWLSGSGDWDVDVKSAKRKLNPERLTDQMFASTVTNQVVGTFVEVGLPFVLRAVESFRRDKTRSGTPHASPDGLKKKVVFEDEKERGGLEERVYLEKVRRQIALPEYDLFTDYNEMVVQFGYVALWSTIWPLAGVMALINNIFELRSDAFKITVHHRRPVPIRTDTIGPWLEALTFLTWLSALTNSALVYLFSPSLASTSNVISQYIETTSFGLLSVVFNTTTMRDTAATTFDGKEKVCGVDEDASALTVGATKELLVKAALIALVASHVYIIVRVVVRHVVERVWWRGSGEVGEREREEREMKERFLLVRQQEQEIDELYMDREKDDVDIKREDEGEDAVKTFWEHDQGVDEIQRIVKEA